MRNQRPTSNVPRKLGGSAALSWMEHFAECFIRDGFTGVYITTRRQKRRGFRRSRTLAPSARGRAHDMFAAARLKLS